MVKMASAVIAHRGPYFFGQYVQAGKQIFQTFFLKLRVFFQSSVQFKNIARVVLAVVQLHGLGVNIRLKRVVRIWQFWQFLFHYIWFPSLSYKVMALVGQDMAAFKIVSWSAPSGSTT